MNSSVVCGLRLLVLSDLHGLHFKTVSDLIDDMRPDWIVLCSDLLPDFSKIPGVGNRLHAQREFWQVYRRTFIRDFARTTLVRGNHAAGRMPWCCAAMSMRALVLCDGTRP